MNARGYNGVAPTCKWRPCQCEGFSLVEVLVAMFLTALMCAGIYTSGVYARGISEKSRLATEARSLAKERLEEMVAAGRENLAMSSCTLVDATTHQSAAGATIRRQPRLIWHAYDGTISEAASAAYAEVHVDVYYVSAITHEEICETISTIIQ